jgi:hypothetical protein
VLSEHQNKVAKARLYTGILDCLKKSQLNQGQIGQLRNVQMLFRGYTAAMISQVPYSAVTILTFETLNDSILNQESLVFSKYD